jgi:hypothetical protein
VLHLFILNSELCPPRTAIADFDPRDDRPAAE